MEALRGATRRAARRLREDTSCHGGWKARGTEHETATDAISAGLLTGDENRQRMDGS